MSLTDSVTIRPVELDDLPVVAQIQAASFGGEADAALERLHNNPRYNLSHIIAADYDGQLIGSAIAFPAKMWLSGVPLSVGAVAGVATSPDYRQNGVAAKMMEFLIARMQAEGHALSVLYPFSHHYYEKFDYAPISDSHAYRIATDNLLTSAEGEQVRPFAPDDLSMLRVIYKGQMTWHNGWFSRSNAWWSELIERWSQLVVFEKEEMIEGYCAYEMKTDDQGREVLRIIELFAVEGEAYRGLFSYLATQTGADIIDYLAPPQAPLRHLLKRPVAEGGQNRGWIFNDLCHITPGPMGRIINLDQALTTRFYTRAMSGERVIKITDPLIPTNEAPLLFRVIDGRPETRPAAGFDPHIETDVRTFSQILCGYLTAKDAEYIGRLRADENSCLWLDNLIADSPLFIQAGDWF